MKFSRKKDFIIIAVIIIVFICLYVFLSPKEIGKKVEIKYYDQLIKTLDLNKDQVFVPKEKVVIEIKDGEVFFESSDCKDQICVHSGKLKFVGQTAACLPNGIIISIVDDKNEIDAIL